MSEICVVSNMQYGIFRGEKSFFGKITPSSYARIMRLLQLGIIHGHFGRVENIRGDLFITR